MSSGNSRPRVHSRRSTAWPPKVDRSNGPGPTVAGGMLYVTSGYAVPGAWDTRQRPARLQPGVSHGQACDLPGGSGPRLRHHHRSCFRTARNADRRMAALRRRRRQHEVLAARSDQPRQRQPAAGRLAMELARQRDRQGQRRSAARRVPGHAAHGQRRALHGHIARRVRRDRPGDRQDALAVRPGELEGAAGRRTSASRIAASAYWTDGTSERILSGTHDAYLISIDAKTGKPDPAFGDNGRVDVIAGLSRYAERDRGTTPSTRRRSSSGTSSSPARTSDDVPPNKEAPRGDVSGYDVRTGKRCGRSARFRSRASSATTPGKTASAEYTGNTNVWSMMTRRRRARLRLPAVRHADQRLLRRPSPRRQPVRREPRLPRRDDRQARLALPGRAPRPVGLRLPRRADPRRHHRRRQAHQGRRAGQQAGVRLRLRSRDRHAGLADRRAAGAAVDGAGREDRRRRSRFRPSRRRSSGRASSRATSSTSRRSCKAQALEMLKRFDRGPLFTPPTERGAVQLPGQRRRRELGRRGVRSETPACCTCRR